MLANEESQWKEFYKKPVGFPDIKREPKNVMDISIDPKAKIKVLDYMPKPKQVEEIKEQGFDGIRYPDETFKTTEDWNPKTLGEFPKDPVATIIFDAKNVKINKDVSRPPKTQTSKTTGTKYYHGAPDPESIKKNGFDLGKAGENSGYPGVYGRGVYITNDLDRAKLYGKPMNMGIEDLKLWDIDSSEVTKTLFNRETKYGDPDLIPGMVIKSGYDGVRIINKDTGMEEIAVFNLKKLKTK